MVIIQPEFSDVSETLGVEFGQRMTETSSHCGSSSIVSLFRVIRREVSGGADE
jgi:hypothetical protein